MLKQALHLHRGDLEPATAGLDRQPRSRARVLRRLHGAVVPDGLRSGVSKASRCEPDVNPTYHEMAEHYGVAMRPARARRLKDKANVEDGLPVVTRWVLARLRHQRFFSRNEPNRSLRPRLAELNCIFHAKLDTHSTANWTPSPAQTGHRFSSKLDSLKRPE